MSMLRMRACGCGERKSLQCAMRGREMSSANRVCPVTLARASTRRRAWPITRRSPSFPLDFVSGGFFGSGICVPDSWACDLAGCFALAGNFEDSRFDSLEDLQIAGAAAKITGQSFANLVTCRMRILVEQGFRGNEDSWSAVAALRGAEICESFLQRVKHAVRAEALYCFNGSSVAFEG